MSFAQTGAGARFIAAWAVRTPSLEAAAGLQHPGLIPFDLFTVTDDRGARYQLDHTPGGDLEWPNHDQPAPRPAAGIRWLDVAAPYRQAVRIDLRSRRPGEPRRAMRPQVSAATRSSARASTCW